MADEQDEVEKDVEAEDVTESPAVEEEAPEETPEETQEESEELEVESKPKKVKPVEKRIHKLVDERNREKAKAESLAKQVEELTSKLTGEPQAVMPNVSTIEPGAEITPEQYRQDVARQAQAITQLELNKERIINRVNKEALEAEKAHPELDPTSDVFDEDLSKTVTEVVRDQVLANPNASVKKLVDQMMKPYRKAIEKKVAEETETITKQVSETAARPSHVKTKEKSLDDMTVEELEEKLGFVY